MTSNDSLIAHALLDRPDYDIFDWLRRDRDRFVPLHALPAVYFSVQIGSMSCTVTESVTGSTTSDAAWRDAAVTASVQLFHLGEALGPAVCTHAALLTRTEPHKDDRKDDEQTVTFAVQACWDELLELPVLLRDLPLDAKVVCRVCRDDRLCLATTSFFVFSLAGELKTGDRDYALHRPGADGDDEQTSVGHCGDEGATSHCSPAPWQRLLRDLQRGQLTSVPWLDALTTASIAAESARAEYDAMESNANSSSSCNSSCAGVGQLHVRLPLAQPPVPVFHIEPIAMGGGSAGEATVQAYETDICTPFVDPEQGSVRLHNICEARATLLSKSLLFSAAHSPPGLRERQRLAEVARRPPIDPAKLRLEDMELLWHHRSFIRRDRRLFLPFLQGVDWHSGVEAAAAAELMRSCRHIGMAEVLGCLSARFAQVKPVRAYAVALLERESDAQLCDVLLQLVQAVRYEEPNDDEGDAEAALGVLPDVQSGAQTAGTGTDGSLASFLLRRALRSWELCCALHWSLSVEAQLEQAGAEAAKDAEEGDGEEEEDEEEVEEQHARATTENNKGTPASTTPTPAAAAAAVVVVNEKKAAGKTGPMTRLLHRLNVLLAARQPVFLRRLRRQRRLHRCLETFARRLQKSGADRVRQIRRGQEMLEARSCGLKELFVTSAAALSYKEEEKDVVSRRLAAAGARAAVQDTADPFLDEPNTVTLPTHPSVLAYGISSATFYVYKSAKMPIRFPFTVTSAAAQHAALRHYNLQQQQPVSRASSRTDSGSVTTPFSIFTPIASPALRAARDVLDMDEPYSPEAAQRAAHGTTPPPQARQGASPVFEVALMYKQDDDVRQDQLVLQLLRVMDKLLRQDGLDLCLTPYRALATAPMQGLVELVPRVVTFQSVQRDALGYLQRHNPDPPRMRAAMNRYTRSFAGYSVLTFILGIGDRHLENILLAEDGRLLHVDFGYILGNDPKPFSPPMKIRREMVEVLGGPQSAGYVEFKSYCCSAYNILREHAALLLQMLYLMRDAPGLPQITGGGVVDPAMNLRKVQDKLRLELSNAQATQYLQNVIADSVGSLFTNLWDVLHAAAQATRV